MGGFSRCKQRMVGCAVLYFGSGTASELVGVRELGIGGLLSIVLYPLRWTCDGSDSGRLGKTTLRLMPLV